MVNQVPANNIKINNIPNLSPYCSLSSSSKSHVAIIIQLYSPLMEMSIPWEAISMELLLNLFLKLTIHSHLFWQMGLKKLIRLVQVLSISVLLVKEIFIAGGRVLMANQAQETMSTHLHLQRYWDQEMKLKTLVVAIIIPQ